jgi:hypothetical protein
MARRTRGEATASLCAFSIDEPRGQQPLEGATTQPHQVIGQAGVLFCDDTIVKRIETALLALVQTYPDCSGAIPYRFTIPSMARSIAIMKRRGRDTTPDSAAVGRLIAISKASQKLSALLECLFVENDPEADLEYGRKEVICALTQKQLRAIIDMRAPLACLTKDTEQAAKSKKASLTKRGAPKKEEALSIAVALRSKFVLLTGKQPGRSVNSYAVGNKENDREAGAFVKLVKGVFDALGITASAPSIARAAMGINQD